MALKVRKDGAWVDVADNSGNTTISYTLPTFGTANGSSGIRLIGSDSTTDDVNITGTNGITVVGNASNNTLTIDGGGAGSNTTYTLPLTGATGGSSVGSAKWTLDASTGTDTSVTLNPGSNINISAITTSGNDRSFTLDATDTTYELKCTKDADGGSTGTDSDPYLFLDASGTGTDDSVRIVGSGNVTVTRDNDGQLTINGSGSSGATTFTGLTDTPASYSGQGGKLVAVKTDLSGTQKLEFIDKLTYDLLGGGTDGSSFGQGIGKIILRPSSGTDDEVSITAGSNIRIDGTSATGFTITADSGGTGATYDYLLVDHGSSTGSGTGNDSILRLNETGTTNNDDIRLIAGSNVTFSPNTSAGTLTIAASGGGTSGVTKVAQLWDQKTSGTDGGTFNANSWIDRTLNQENDPNSIVVLNSGNVYWELEAGTYRITWSAPANNVHLHKTRLVYADNSGFSSPTYIKGSSGFDSANMDPNSQTRSFGDTQLTIPAKRYFKIQHRCTIQQLNYGLGGATGIDAEVYTQVFIEDLATAVKDAGLTIKDEGTVLPTLATTLNFVGSNVTATGTGAEKTITVSGGTGTTYTLPVFGTSNGSSGIKLTPDGGTASSAQTINITGSGNISVTGSGQTLTIDGGSISGTTYDLSALLSPGIKLEGSDGSNDSIFFDSDSSISITRTVAPGSNGGGTLHFSATAQAGTTYELLGGGTNSSTFPGGTGTINLKTGGSIQDTVTVTAGDNIRIDTTGEGGFKIHAAEVGSTGLKLKNTGGGGNSAAVFQLYTTSNPNGNADQRITITPGTGIEFTNTTQGLIIQSDGSSSTLNVSAPTNQSGPLLFVTGTGNNKTVYGDTALTWNAGTDTLNIGANSSDKVAINADVSTHIYPSANEAFDIGESPTNRWRKLYVKEVEADLILGSFSINTNDEEVLFTRVSGATKLVAGSSKFKFDESAGELQISNTGNNNFVHLTQDGGVEICRSNASTGGSGGAYVDFKDGTSDDYDSRIQLITSSANGNANGNLPGGLQFICGVNKPKAVVTTEGVFGISGNNEEISNSTGNFCPGRPPNQPWGNSLPWPLDVNGQVYVRRAGTSGNEGGHITLQDGDKGRGWSIDAYRGNNQSSGDRSRFRILSENSVANAGGRADQLFCMNRNGAVAWGGHKDNSNWPSGGDGHGNEDYGSSGAVLMSRGSDMPPIWSSTGSVSPEFSSPLRLARDNSTGEGGGILLAKSNSATFAAGWEIDCNGTTSNPDYRVIDSVMGQVRFGVQGASGAICVGQMGNWGQSGQVIMSQGSGNVATYSHRPAVGAWWHSSKSTVPVIHTDGVMEIGKYLDFHVTRTVASDYSARIENNAATPTALIVRNYIQQYSDSRLKDNLVAISSPLDKVGIITGYTYNYTNTDEESPSRTGGVIAQDVEKVLPELIHDSSDGFKTLNYNGIAALLVEAVKELKAKNTALEARIAALESS